MKAVILAAGQGIRLRPLTNEIPKGLISIESNTLLEYSLKNLNIHGITEVLIVIGYLGDMIKEKLGTYSNGIDIKYIMNEEYSTTGSMYSLSKTEGLIDDDILLLESDLLYESNAISYLLESSEKNVILTAELSGSKDEVYICVDDNNNLIDLGKNISNKENAVGELVGISKFSKNFLTKLYRTAQLDYERGEKNKHYEEVIFILSKSIPVKCLLKKIIWIEIDKEMDLILAKDRIFPKLPKE